MPRPPEEETEGPPPGPYHIPVLLEQSIAFLQPRAGHVHVDCTLGGGGHAEALLRHSAPDGVVIGIDRDPEALAAARTRLAEFGDRARLVHGTFDEVAAIVRAEGFPAAHAVLFDLGVSSRQLDRADRGFSFRQEGPLDMRMDPTTGVPASELVNTLPERELEQILRDLGEERLAGRIVRAIGRERAKAPIETTSRLEQIIWGAVPASYRHGRIHPATRTFQALRMEVNREMELLREALRNAVEILAPGGRLVVISYHSGEDREAKTLLRELAGKSGPMDERPEPVLHILTPKPVTPSDEETAANPRARSAKLRAAERTQDF